MFGRHGPHIQRAQFFGQRGALRVVDVEHRRAQAGPAEQLALGQPVGVHAAVVVQVVAREVGEQRDVDQRRIQPVFVQADGRGFERAGGKTGVGKTAEGGVQRHRVGRGQAGEVHRAGLTNAQRTDHAAAPAQRRQRLRHPPRGGGLAVGAGGGHDVQPRTGLAVEVVRDRAGGGLQARQRGDARVFEAEGLDALGFHQAGGGAGLQRRGHEAPAVVGITRPRDEGIARLHQAAVGAQRALDPGGQPAGSGLRGFQTRQRHQKLSISAGPGVVTMPGLNSMSGATPMPAGFAARPG